MKMASKPTLVALSSNSTKKLISSRKFKMTAKESPYGIAEQIKYENQS